MNPREPITITGPEPARLDLTRADGGLAPLPGVRSFCVFRASRDTKPVQLGYTYHHHVDMAAWKGKLYVGWNTCLKDEDLWPSRELLSVSDDGITWSDPIEMFPQGVSTPLRMYFFLAPNGRMLIIAGLRPDEGETIEENKHGLVVRELRADHTLGPVFTLQPQGAITKAPMFDMSDDAGFVDACRALLADRVYLEQQDRGTLLGERAMKWHEALHWPGGVLPGTKEGEENVKWTFGKALTFFNRADGAIVGTCKLGWTIVSTDHGETWSTPTVPSSFITGKAKVFAQNHRDGTITLAYNPSTSHRYPLAIVTSRDGVHFSRMRLVQGELPRQRYDGRFRSIGPQYVRGLSRWSDDGSRDEACTWLVYSMNKEDLWVSRVPIPIVANVAEDTLEPIWNVYQPKWSSVVIEDETATLECRDPYDSAAVTRVIRANTQAVWITLTVDALPRDCISIDVFSGPTRDRTCRVELRADLVVYLNDQRLCAFAIGQQLLIPLTSLVDARDITVRTGPYRNVGGKDPVDAGMDVPAEPVCVTVHAITID